MTIDFSAVQLTNFSYQKHKPTCYTGIFGASLLCALCYTHDHFCQASWQSCLWLEAFCFKDALKGLWVALAHSI